MKNTLGLLRIALIGRTTNDLAAMIAVGPTTITMWKKAGRVSPEGAAKLAELLREPIGEWVAIAAAEQLPEPKRSWLMRQLTALFVLGVVGLTILTAPYSADARQIAQQAQPLGSLGIMLTKLRAWLYGKLSLSHVVRTRTTRAADHNAGTWGACPTS